MDEYDREMAGDDAQVTKEATDAQMYKEISSILQLLIYLCCDNRDTPPIQHPKLRMRRSGAVDSPKEVRTWDVGIRISQAIRNYSNSTVDRVDSNSTHASPRPHIRRAHYHKFLTGPRDGKRGYVVHWIPPLPVGMKWDTENNTPIVVHKVDSAGDVPREDE